MTTVEVTPVLSVRGVAIERASLPAPGRADAATLAAADATCLAMATRHYENFTVASRLLPRPLRVHLSRLYAYCRVTDDLGDESGGDATGALLRWRGEVLEVFDGVQPRHPVLLALAQTIAARDLPAAPFLDLVDANLQDQAVHAYATWPDLLAYCALSAAPVGRLVLRIAGVDSAQADRLSDDVCVGLQLANFAQDVAVDAAKGRCYLVAEDLREVGVEGAVARMCDRAESLLQSGRALEESVDGGLAMQLALYRRGGLAIVESIRRRDHRTAEGRPTVGALTKVALAGATLPVALRRRRRTSAERFCSAMARREARNFYWGFVALPRPQRTAIHALYDLARQLDDAVDGVVDTGAARAALAVHRRRIDSLYDGVGADPVADVLVAAVRRHAIPRTELQALVDGVERDLEAERYRTWVDLAGYCRLVASSVGRLCVRVFGYTDSQALDRADELGLALQLTNILRDVREDAALGRIYLPLEDLAESGVDPDDLLRGRPGRGWADLVALQVDRARALYASGLAVTEYIPRRAAICVRTMAGIYAAILSEVERAPRRVLEERVSLPPSRKLAILATAATR